MSRCQICNASVRHNREVFNPSTRTFNCVCLDCGAAIADTLSEFEPEETNEEKRYEV